MERQLSGVLYSTVRLSGSTDKGISSAQIHRLMLTMEMANATDSGYNLWGFASGRFADNLRTKPAEAQVDWVTVDKKSTPDANLCN